MVLPAREPGDLPRVRRGVDRWGNPVWFFFDHAVRVDESGLEPKFCLKDCFEANGIKRSAPGTIYSKLDGHRGLSLFKTPGGPQSFVTITEQGFYVLTMRGHKPASEEFRRWLAEVATQLRKSGVVDVRTSAPASTTPSVTSSASPLDLLVQQTSILHQTAVHLAEQGRRMGEIEARVDRIEQIREEATREMLSLPEPSVPAPPRTPRHNVVEHIRGFCKTTGTDFQSCFSKFYREVRYRLGCDVYARKRNNPEKYDNLLDVIDEVGLMDKAYALAREVFTWEPRMAE